MDLYHFLTYTLVPTMRNGKQILKKASHHRIQKQAIILFVISTMIALSRISVDPFLVSNKQGHSVLPKSLRDTLYNNAAHITKSDLSMRRKTFEKQKPDLLFTRFRQGDPNEDEERRRMLLNSSQKHSLSPLGRTPMGDRVVLIWAHLLLILPLVALGIMQWWKQGGKAHLRRGDWLLVLWSTFLFAGWVMQIKQLRAGAQKSADMHIYPPEIAWVLLIADMKITLTSVNALYLRKLQAVRSSFRSFALIVLLMAHVSNIIISIYAIGFTLDFVFNGNNDYLSEIAREAIVSLVTIMVFDITEVKGIWKWRCTGKLDWKEQHRMACTYLTLEFFGVPASFVAHDATWFFEYPGLGIQKRIFVQLVPPVLFALATPGTIKAIFTYQHQLWSETDASLTLRSQRIENWDKKSNDNNLKDDRPNEMP